MAVFEIAHLVKVFFELVNLDTWLKLYSAALRHRVVCSPLNGHYGLVAFLQDALGPAPQATDEYLPPEAILDLELVLIIVFVIDIYLLLDLFLLFI